MGDSDVHLRLCLIGLKAPPVVNGLKSDQRPGEVAIRGTTSGSQNQIKVSGIIEDNES